jgi:Uma2 family endonuclease
MSQIVSPTEFCVPLIINVQRTNLTAEQFFMLCQENEELRLELTARQELIIMPLVGGLDGMRNARLSSRLLEWADKDGTGMAFGSNVGVTFPNGAVRSPDAFWIKQQQWDALTKEQKETFAPVCPVFVVELRSRGERAPDLHEKMQEYIDNGVRLGWLIDPFEKRVSICRPEQPVETLDNPPSVSGEPVVPGFVLQVRELWS